MKIYVTFTFWWCLAAGVLISTWAKAQPINGEFKCEVVCRPTTSSSDAGYSLDAGAPAQDAGAVNSDAGVDAGTTTAWSLYTRGNRILLPNGAPARLRGANVFDTRMCGACSNENWTEVRRKLSIAVTEWKMNFLRLNLEESFSANQAYFDGLKATIEYMRLNHPNTYVMVSVWSDSQALTNLGTGDPNGGPNVNTPALWRIIAAALKDEPNVLFGISNEPRNQPDAVVWDYMRQCVDAIRGMELVNQPHVIVAQGTQSWGRTVGYYVTHSLGPNVAYETHIYDSEADWRTLLAPAASIPVLIGEFGTGANMTQGNVDNLIRYAEANDIPWVAWSFTRACSPDLISPDATNSRCSAGTWTPSVYGTAIKNRLAKPWGAQ